jgi:hypothetical protein
MHATRDAKPHLRRQEFLPAAPCAARASPLIHTTQAPLHNLPPLTISRPFHSLSKVLFIFPSRYLFAIGLLPLFSLGCVIPPVLRLHSQAIRLPRAELPVAGQRPRDSHPLWCPFPKDLAPPTPASFSSNYNAPEGFQISSSSHFTRRYYGNPC